MTRVGRWLRRLLEKVLNRWSEGPEPPRRIADEARLFWHANPNATPAEWERFAIALAGNAYRDAFVRGFEWNERCWPETTIDGHAVGLAHAHDVSLGDGHPRVRRLLSTIPRGMTIEQQRLIGELASSPYPVRIEFADDQE